MPLTSPPSWHQEQPALSISTSPIAIVIRFRPIYLIASQQASPLAVKLSISSLWTILSQLMDANR